MQFGEELMAWFPWEESAPGAAGTLVYHKEFYEPRDNGTLVYFASEDCNNEMARIEAASGKIVQEKKMISEDIGYMAVFLDSEGNRIALHSRA